MHGRMVVLDATNETGQYSTLERSFAQKTETFHSGSMITLERAGKNETLKKGSQKLAHENNSISDAA